MTGKDLLEGLNFVDEDLIEEAGKETLSAETTEEKLATESAEEKRRLTELVEEKKRSAELVEMKIQSKSGKHSGKVVFLRAAVSVAAGLLIFVAGTAVGSHKAVKPRPDGQTAYTLTEEDQNENEHAPAQGVHPEDQAGKAGQKFPEVVTVMRSP